MPEQPKSIIQLFSDNELLVSRLYDLYAEMIPGHSDFWKKMAQEELEHAKTISEVFSNQNLSSESFKENNFTRGVIKYVTDYVNEQIQNAQKKKLTQIEAINIALRVEQSVLEKKYFEMFVPTNAPLESILLKMNDETKIHVQRLRKELQKQLNQKK